jgi:hypothetical protein
LRFSLLVHSVYASFSSFNQNEFSFPTNVSKLLQVEIASTKNYRKKINETFSHFDIYFAFSGVFSLVFSLQNMANNNNNEHPR